MLSSLVFVLCLGGVPSAPPAVDLFGSVKGVVHDPQHRPVPGATVTLKAQRADWVRIALTGSAGDFEFTAVPLGDYAVSVVLQGFEAPPQLATVVSGPAPVLHFQLELGSVRQDISVSASAESARPASATPTTLVSRDDVAGTPGADRSNSLAIITAYVPGSYTTHDQLHVRGGHQVTWLVDGVPVPNTNIASNVGPQFDPKDIDYLEIQRGSYDAAYGDRTYGVFNVVPRTGFERTNEAELVLNAGDFRQTNDQISIGSHTPRVAYYASANYNQSNLGLETPVAQILHDRQSGFGGFGSLVVNIDPHNQFRIVTSARRDHYQIPNSPDAVIAGTADNERESDAFVNASWVHTFTANALLTVSPFYHDNRANYEGGAQDFPVSTTDKRASRYAGAQVTFGAERGRQQIQAGFYGFHQQDDQLFGLTFNDGSRANFTDRERPSGNLAAVFVQDTVTVASGFTVTGGVRQTHFSGGLAENATSPRVGAAFQIPSWGWTVRGFYGRFYQGPPLLTASGPLVAFVTNSNLGFIPLHGERDVEYQVGVVIPVRGWTIDGDRFQTRATNFFDHNSVGNSNVFFPLTIDGALIQGWELTMRSPRTWRRGQFHLAYSRQRAQGRGAISGGLTDFSPPNDYFPLDHDQRHTLSAGVDGHFPHGVFASANVYYGSGFADIATGGHLPGHATADVSVGTSIGPRVSLSLNVLNVLNRHLLIDSSPTFGGVHFNNPREVYAEVRYRFHY